MFLKLDSVEPQDSAKGCEGFRKTKMRNVESFIDSLKFLCTSVNAKSVVIMVF